MKTLRLYIISYALVLATLLIVPIGTACAYDGNGSSDRLSDGSSSVFSPGYINAAKQKTEAVRDQMYPQKSFMERLVENIKGGVADNVDETVATKVTADIKKKTSAKSTAAQTTPVTISEGVNPNGIPAYVCNKAQEYINGQGGSAAYIYIKPNGENYSAVWVASDGFSIKTQIFNSDGVAAITQPKILNGPSNYVFLSRVITLSNGNLAVVWMERDSNYKYSIKTQTINSDGSTVLPAPITLGGESTSAFIDDIVTLSNSNIAVFWHESISGGKNVVKFQIINSEGRAELAAPTTLSDVSGTASLERFTTLLSGNIVVFWNESVNGQGSVKSRIISSDGKTILSSPATLLSWTSGYAAIQNVTTLSNGNLAIFMNTEGGVSLSSIKCQVIDPLGNIVTVSPVTLTDPQTFSYPYSTHYINKVATLANGDLAVFWREMFSGGRYSLKYRTMKSDGTAALYPPIELSGLSINPLITNIATLSNGNLAVFFYDTDLDSKCSIKVQIVDSTGNLVGSSTTLSGLSEWSTVLNVTTLSNSNLAVFWVELGSNGKQSIKSQIVNSGGGKVLSSPIAISGNEPSTSTYSYITSVNTLSNGSLAVFWSERGPNSLYTFKTQVIDQAGTFVPITILIPPTPPASTNNLTQDLLPDTFLNSLKSNILKNSSYGWELRSAFNNSSNNAVPEIFKSLLSSKGALATNMGRPTNEAELGRLITKALSSAIGVPGLTENRSNTPEMQVAMALANILKNPTEDQKIIIDAVAKLLEDVSKIEGEAGKSEELTKAENDLLKMAAAVLFAQGVPDLLKEGDVENMKGMFKDLGASKDKALMDYKDSVKPYYNNIAKEIAANIAVLETKGMVKKNLTEEQLKKLEPREIDRILENIRKNNDKSFELEYLLQQDSKYRKEYLDPSKKLMEDNMKIILGSFAKKLSDALEDKK